MIANPGILIVDGKSANIWIMAAAITDNHKICCPRNSAEAAQRDAAAPTGDPVGRNDAGRRRLYLMLQHENRSSAARHPNHLYDRPAAAGKDLQALTAGGASGSQHGPTGLFRIGSLAAPGRRAAEPMQTSRMSHRRVGKIAPEAVIRRVTSSDPQPLRYCPAVPRKPPACSLWIPDPWRCRPD